MAIRPSRDSERQSVWGYLAPLEPAERTLEHPETKARRPEAGFDLLEAMIPEWPGAANAWA
jgi:hypothetical protein